MNHSSIMASKLSISPIFLLIFLFLFSIFYWPMIYSLNLYFLIDYDI